MAAANVLSGTNKSFLQFSEVIRKYLGITDVLEMNRFVMEYYSSCKNNKIDEKNVSMFVNFVMNHSTYTRKSREIFEDVIRDLHVIISDHEITPLYTDFTKPAMGTTIHPITKEKVIDFIKTTSYYMQSLQQLLFQLIKQEYPTHNVTKIPDSLLEYISTHAIDHMTSTIHSCLIKFIVEFGDEWLCLVDRQTEVSKGDATRILSDLDITFSKDACTIACQTQVVMTDYEDHDACTLSEPANDIISLICQQYAKNAKNANIATQGNPSPPETFVKRALHVLSSKERIIDLLYAQEYTIAGNVSKRFSQDVIQIFESVYGRPITVHEYLKLTAQLQSTSTRDSYAILQQKIRDSHTKFIEMMQTIDTIHENYFGKRIEQYRVISSFMERMEKEGFYEDLIDEILANVHEPGVYESRIKDTLTSMYKTIYDQDVPSESDLHYYFLHARKQKYHLKSKELHTMLMERKTETDQFIEEMRVLYRNVLQRDPDTLEIVHYLSYYRDDLDREQPMQHTNTRIEDEMYESLEYLDVLKERIRAVYQSVYSNPPLPSVMYQWLKVVSGDVILKRASTDVLKTRIEEQKQTL
jgi:hypothetical protein